MAISVYIGFVAISLFHVCGGEFLKDVSGHVALNYHGTSDGIHLELVRGGVSKVVGTIGKGRNFEGLSCLGTSSCQIGDHGKLRLDPIVNGFNVTWESDDPTAVFEDCYFLNSTETNWFGGPQRYNQVWPLEKMTIDGDEPYIIKKSDNFGVAERYWLNSKGVYIWLNDSNALWVDQNNKTSDEVCFRTEAKSPYINRWRNFLVYVLIALDDSKAAHLYAVNNYLGKPQKYPNEKMISEPIWTTWAKYYRNIDDATILEFSDNIRDHGYTGGQLEIDDGWETCYGAQEFNETKFPNISETVDKLHNESWRVTLWIHPFVNDDCQNNSAIGLEAGYFVRNTTNDTNAIWWNSDNAHQIDFTNNEAADWWVARLKTLQDDIGIDSFKFDAGETDYVNQPAVFDDVENSPNILTQKYIETCAAFGDLIEVRSSFRGQQYGEFIRMLDKDSNWSLDDGLASLITTLLQLNMNGYGLVLPDMIGGNGYTQQPNIELIIRWMQANTFMPAMQFSYLPWEYEVDGLSYDIEAITKTFITLHQQYAPNITNAMNKSVEDGSPVNPPIWWVDPTDATALATDDEYLLGEDILVAPVIVEGANGRDVYLPKGKWKDANYETVYEGPTTLKDYYAPIEILPYFIKQQEES